MIKVLIVDDQLILRESLKFIIEQDSDIKVVGCACNGLEAVEFCKKNPPDVILMDIKMPVCDGIEGTKLIKSQFETVKIMVLTTFNDDENISKALKNGADGYILKDIMPDELILAIRSINKGLNIIHKNALNSVVRQFNANDTVELQARSIKVDLTDREISIVELIVDGKSNKEIAAVLFITEGTVKNIITGILEKLELKDRTQLAVFAVRNKLV